MSVKQLFDLTGQVALVTGGSRGLGLQMAEALGEMGAKLAITARKADELAEALKNNIISMEEACMSLGILDKILKMAYSGKFPPEICLKDY